MFKRDQLKKNKDEFSTHVKSALLADVTRCNPAFPVDRTFRHLSLKRSQQELSQTETGCMYILSVSVGV